MLVLIHVHVFLLLVVLIQLYFIMDMQEHPMTGKYRMETCGMCTSNVHCACTCTLFINNILILSTSACVFVIFSDYLSHPSFSSIILLIFSFFILLSLLTFLFLSLFLVSLTWVESTTVTRLTSPAPFPPMAHSLQYRNSYTMQYIEQVEL